MLGGLFLTGVRSSVCDWCIFFQSRVNPASGNRILADGHGGVSWSAFLRAASGLAGTAFDFITMVQIALDVAFPQVGGTS